MRKLLRTGMILTVTWAAIGGGFLGGPQDGWLASPNASTTIEVSCPDAEGCFLLISKAIEQAPTGATIRIAPGTYYEKPLTIEKSLSLEGIPTETGRYPRIVLVDIGTAILVQGGSALTVELQRLSIEALAQDPFSDRGEGIGVRVFSQTSEEVRVALREVDIRSYQGITIAGDQPGELFVEVVDADIRAALVGIEVNTGNLILHRSQLRGPAVVSLLTPWIGIFMQPSPSLRIEALLTENHIEGFSIGLMAAASSQLRMGRVALQGVGNVIASNRQDGLSFAGDRIDVELSRNEIRGNGGYGIKLALPACAPEGARPELRFQGVIQGEDNLFSQNEQGDLCPEDYPWPEGFTAP